MCRINPKVDLVFKKLFGSEENKDILKSFINSHLPAHQQLTEVQLKNPYNLADYIDGKMTILDIKAVDEKGTWYDVEMQVEPHDYYGQRALYYWGKVFTDQMESGGLYSALNKTIVISILDYNCFPDEIRHHRVIAPRDIETSEEYPMLDYMDLHFVELKKFKKELSDIRTTLDRWITFLNNAPKYEKDRIPPELAQDNEVRKAIEKLDIMYLNEKERDVYEAERKLARDRAQAIESADAKGFARGQKEGKEEGKAESKQEMAKRVLQKGLSIELAAELTNLSIDEIKKL